MTRPPIILRCDLDRRPADPLDALERLYRSETEGDDHTDANAAWVAAMVTAEATLNARGRSVRPFDECFEEVGQ